MSSGADCHFHQRGDGQWSYAIQRYPYGETEEYDRHGPFPSFKAAYDHLHSNYQNPGGFSTMSHPDYPDETEEVFA